MLRLLAAITLAGFVLGASGCSQDSLGRQAVSGAVRVDGAPLAQGSINFEPIEGQPTAGGSPITDGRYAVSRAGGLVAGKYRVSINAATPGTGGEVDEESLPGDPPRPPKELIPPKWNTASEETIQVKKDGKNEFNFEILTKGGAAKSSGAKTKS